MLSKIDKARIYINHEHKHEKVKNSDIEIRKGGYMVNWVEYDTIISPTNKFFSFPYTDKVHNYYLSLRIEKLLKLELNINTCFQYEI